MTDNIKEYRPKCPVCKSLVTKPNKLIKPLEDSSYRLCLICWEKRTHKRIVSYLEGKTSAMYACGEDGCSVIIPERDYLKYRTNDELLEELKRRLEGESND